MKLFWLFSTYKLLSSIRAGSVMSGFSKWDSTVNVVSYGSNTLWCVLGWYWELLIIDWIIKSLYFDTCQYQNLLYKLLFV